MSLIDVNVAIKTNTPKLMENVMSQMSKGMMEVGEAGIKEAKEVAQVYTGRMKNSITYAMNGVNYGANRDMIIVPSRIYKQKPGARQPGEPADAAESKDLVKSPRSGSKYKLDMYVGSHVHEPNTEQHELYAAYQEFGYGQPFMSYGRIVSMQTIKGAMSRVLAVSEVTRGLHN